MNTSDVRSQIVHLLQMELLPKFTDDYIDEWIADGNSLVKLHEIIDTFAEEIGDIIQTAIQTERTRIADTLSEMHSEGCDAEKPSPWQQAISKLSMYDISLISQELDNQALKEVHKIVEVKP